MTKRTYDSILLHQQMFGGDPAVYVVGKCYQSTYTKNASPQESLVDCGETPVLLPRRSRRILVMLNAVAYFEFRHDTSFAITSSQGRRTITAKTITPPDPATHL